MQVTGERKRNNKLCILQVCLVIYFTCDFLTEIKL